MILLNKTISLLLFVHNSFWFTAVGRTLL